MHRRITSLPASDRDPYELARPDDGIDGDVGKAPGSSVFLQVMLELTCGVGVSADSAWRCFPGLVSDDRVVTGPSER